MAPKTRTPRNSKQGDGENRRAWLSSRWILPQVLIYVGERTWHLGSESAEQPSRLLNGSREGGCGARHGDRAVPDRSPSEKAKGQLRSSS